MGRLTARGGQAAGLIIALMLALTVVGCGGGGEDTPTPTATRTATVTPSATETASVAATAPAAPSPVPSATPAPVPTAEEAPHAPPIELDPGVEERREEVTELTFLAGATVGLEPVQLAGADFPSCATFVFAFSWQVREPYPADGVILRVFRTRMENKELLAEATSGSATVGCSFIEFVNASYVPITVELRYVVGAIGGGP